MLEHKGGAFKEKNSIGDRIDNDYKRRKPSAHSIHHFSMPGARIT